MIVFVFPACGMEICVDQKNGFQQENTQWKYINEEPLEKIYLAGNSEINEPTLRNHSIVYIVPNIEIAVDTITNKIYRTTKYDFTICEKLFEKFVIDFELCHDYLIKLRVSDKLCLPSYPYERGFYLNSDQTLSWYKIIVNPYLISWFICELNSFSVSSEQGMSGGFEFHISNTSPYLGINYVYQQISPCIQDTLFEDHENHGMMKVHRKRHCAIF